MFAPFSAAAEACGYESEEASNNDEFMRHILCLVLAAGFSCVVAAGRLLTREQEFLRDQENGLSSGFLMTYEGVATKGEYEEYLADRELFHGAAITDHTAPSFT